MRRFIYAASAVVLAGYASTALAYTPQWLECTGDVTVTPANGPPTKEAAKDIYVFDSDTSNLFKYSEARKSLAYVGARPGKTPMDIRWSGTSSGIGGSSWDGQLDRTGMSLRLTYKSEDETRAWAETCAPTAARPEG